MGLMTVAKHTAHVYIQLFEMGVSLLPHSLLLRPTRMVHNFQAVPLTIMHTLLAAEMCKMHSNAPAL